MDGGKPRILVTGGSSLPGYRAIIRLLKHGYSVIAQHYRNEVPIEHRNLLKVRLDLRDYGVLKGLIDKYEPNIVVHMAAYGDVDGCERDRGYAWSVNVRGTMNLVESIRDRNIFLIYLSTDYVFDGVKGYYGEYDPPNPINFYGLTKLAGELIVQGSGLRHAIIRASSIYGFGPGRVNFAKFLVDRLSRGLEVKALIDQYTSPTHATLLAEAIHEVIERDITGIMHIVGERLSRYEFALRIAESLGLDEELIVGARMDEFRWLARRPRDSSLRIDETRRHVKSEFHNMDRALRILAEEYYAYRETATL